MRRKIILSCLAIALVGIIACGGTSSEPVIVEREVIKEVIKEVVVEKEVIKEVPVQVIVEKEVIKEVEKLVVVIATPAPARVEEQSFMSRGKYGGVLTYYSVADPAKWDPHSRIIHTHRGTASIYNLLVKHNPENVSEIIGDLAKSWKLSSDGRVYTFKLFDNVKNHDGTDLTAADVVASVERWIEEGKPRGEVGKTKAYYESGNAKAIDRNTVEIKTKFATAEFLGLIARSAHAIIPKHIIDSEIDLNIAENAVGSGPFMNLKYTKGEFYEFEKNPNYFRDGLPFLDGAKVFIISDKGRAITAMLTEQVLGHIGFACSCSTAQVQGLEKEGAGKIRLMKLELGPEGVMLNWTKPPYDDPKVRRAVFLALDRQAINQAVYQGMSALGSHITPPGSLISEEEIKSWPGYRYTPDGKKDPRDLERAKELLAEAGHPEGFKTTFLVRGASGTYNTSAPFIKAALAKVGIDVKLNVVESAAGIKMIRGGDFDLTMLKNPVGSSSPDAAFLSGYLKPGSTQNALNYEDPKFREIFERQARETDPEKRRAILREAEEYLTFETAASWITLFWTAHFGVLNVQVQNYEIPPSITVLNTLEHIWIDEDAPPLKQGLFMSFP